MIKKIKTILIVLAIISGLILAVLFLQDRTKKLEDREYKEINSIAISTDSANINFYKSDNENVRVVIYGSSKDFVEIIEGTRNISISKMSGDTKCLLNCRSAVDIYIPENITYIDIKSTSGNITSDVDISRIKINVDSGNITLNKVNSLNVISNSGNVVLDKIAADRDSTIKTEIGNVVIGTVTNSSVSANSQKGSVVIPYIKEEYEFTLKIESSKGNVDIAHHENKSE